MKGVKLAGRYTLERSLARGGMGTVWRAQDEVLHRAVAVKLLNEGLVEDARASERFRREALTAASITHPRMANVFDYVDHDGRPGIVMEYVDGETLAALIARDAPLMPVRAVQIADAVLDALAAAHVAGIVHRDIKPGNILLTANGEVKVSDFGVARALGDATLTHTGTLVGTPHYIAPEQINGAPASPATDVYALGAVLYEMLTGRRPFEGDTPIAVAMARLSKDPIAPCALDPSIPKALERTVMRALARDPADRFVSADQMRAALAASPVVSTDTAVLELAPSDETIELTALPPEPLIPDRHRVVLTTLRPWLVPAAAIAAAALLGAVVAATVDDPPAASGAPASSPARAIQSTPTPTPTPRATKKPLTVSGATGNLIAVVTQGVQRDEIDRKTGHQLLKDARELEREFSRGETEEAYDKLRDLAGTLEDAADDEEITSRRFDLVANALQRLERALERASED